MFNFFKKEDYSINPLDSLVDNIIKEAALADLPEADLNFLKGNLSLQLDRCLGAIILENLDEAGLAEYNKLLGDNLVPDPDKLGKLLLKYIPDYEDKIKAGLDEFATQAVKSLRGE